LDSSAQRWDRRVLPQTDQSKETKKTRKVFVEYEIHRCITLMMQQKKPKPPNTGRKANTKMKSSKAFLPGVSRAARGRPWLVML
jgi:hypothetical protein